MNRFTYIEHAYRLMGTWLKQGSQKVQWLKRYMHRHMELPPVPELKRHKIVTDDAKEMYCHFAWHYVNSLLTYCSDDLKSGGYTVHTLLCVRSHSLTQVTLSWAPEPRELSGESPSERSATVLLACNPNMAAHYLSGGCARSAWCITTRSMLFCKKR